MARMTDCFSTVNRRALLSVLLLAAALASWQSPAASAQQPGARQAPMSKVLALIRGNKALGSCHPALAVSISPSPIVFPSAIPVGTSGCASPQSFTVTNAGNVSLDVAYVSTDTEMYGGSAPLSAKSYYGDYSFDSSGCSEYTLAPGASCTGSVTFCAQPSASQGSKLGTLFVYTSAPSSPHAVTLTGTVGPGPLAPVFSATPDYLDFGNVPLGSTSDAQHVTVRNIGSAPMTVNSITATPPFAVDDDGCTAVPVPPGDVCGIDVTFIAGSAPQSEVSGTLTINHSAAGSPGSVSLYANAVALPGVTLLSPTGSIQEDLNIDVEVGSVISATVFFKNLSPGSITIYDLFLDCVECGISIVSDNCYNNTIATGQTCSVDLQLDATYESAGNTLSDILYFGDGESTYQVDLYGYVTAPYSSVDITPWYNDFGAVGVGSQSACVNFQVTNMSSATIYLSAQGPYYGQFTAAGCTPPGATCSGSAMAPEESCWASLRYAPSGTGYASDYLDIYYSDGESSPAYVAGAFYEGYGIQPGPMIDVYPGYWSFGSQQVGSPAPSRAFTVTNIGDQPLNISAASVAGPEFTVSPDAACTPPATLAPGSSCTITGNFTPSAVGYFTDNLTITSDAVNTTAYVISMDGSGAPLPTPSADYYPMSLDFGSVPYNATSAAKTVFFANPGSAPMAISSILSSAGDFLVSHDCPAILDANSCCRIFAQFHPTTVVPQTEMITVTTDAGDSPHQITVTGTGIPPPSITASPAGFAFPDQVVGTASAPVAIVFTNTGITNVTVSGYTVSGDFQASAPVAMPLIPASAPLLKRGTTAHGKAARSKAAAPPPIPCGPGDLAIGDACYVTVVFKPTALDLRTGSLVLAFSGGTGNPAVVPLAGYGMPAEFPAISLSTDVIDFGEVVVGTSSSKLLTVTSTGTAPLVVSGVSTPGAGGIFLAETACRTVAPGASCAITVTCTPSLFTNVTGDLYVDSNVRGIKHVTLICTGARKPVPKIDVSLTSIGFGNQSLGTSSNAQQLLIKSVGTAPLAIRGIGTNSPFAVDHACPATLEPGSSCIARVNFTPMRPGGQADKLGIGSNDPDRPAINVDLSGTGCRPFSVTAARRGTDPCGP
ncbi:MAG: choice-of-anchor D domain-containing protein [Betaproteobacteria bacterium]|nr:choice-of-anchor D domain-containing protein [Betaproteobacteria bacterium]